MGWLWHRIFKDESWRKYKLRFGVIRKIVSLHQIFRDMKTINVQMSDMEYNTLGLSKNNFFFSEISDLIEQQIARQALRRSVEMADVNGLSSMTMEEINAEINAVRQCIKSS